MYRVMELAGAKILTVPVDENGMNCEVLESLLTQTRPRLIFVNSSYHDPTGNILSLERRKKIVELSNRYRVPIVEEDAANSSTTAISSHRSRRSTRWATSFTSIRFHSRSSRD